MFRPLIRPSRYHGSCISAMSIPLTLTALDRNLDAAILCGRLVLMNDMVFTMSISAYLGPRVLNFFASTSRFTECKLLGDRCCPQKMGASPTPRRHESCPVAPFLRSPQSPDFPFTGALRKVLAGIPRMGLSCSTGPLSAAPFCGASDRYPFRSPQVRSAPHTLSQPGFDQLPLFAEPLS